MGEEDVGGQVVEKVGVGRGGVAEGTGEEGSRAVTEVELAGSRFEMSAGGV